ncbi:MAG: hypothetical protein ACQES2_07165 [Pseudomonadota bacterium]
MMKFAKHHLLALALTSTASAVSAFDLYVDTTMVAGPDVTLDVYNLLPGDSGHGADGPGGDDGTADLGRSGIYECDQDTIENFAGPEEVIADEGVNPGGKLDLVEAIRLASSCLANRSNTIFLKEDKTYTLTQPDNFWFGPNALPPVRGSLTIVGNGATIERDDNGAPMRFLANFGELNISDVTFKGGVALGGGGSDGAQAGGGGAGLGGAIYNRGGLTLARVTFQGNTAEGGAAGDNSVSTPDYGAGGGLGGNANGVTGGGFFGTEFLGGEAGNDTIGGTSSTLFGCSGLTNEECRDRAEGGRGQDGAGGGGGAFGGGGTQSTDASGEGGLGGGFAAGDDPGENGGGWLVGAAISGGAGGIGGGGGPGATGGFGAGSGGGQGEAAFGGGAENQGGAAYGAAIFNHAGALKIQNSTFSGNVVRAGLDSGGSMRSNKTEGAGVYSLNSRSTPGANQWEFNTFYQNTCDSGSGCNGASAAVRLSYAPGLERHPGSEEDSGNYIKEEVESSYSLFGNILDAQASSHPLLFRVDNPEGSIESQKLKFLATGVNNLMPDGKEARIEDQVGAVGAAVWNSCDDTGAIGSQVFVLCGPAPKMATGGIDLLALSGNGGLTHTHMPAQEYLADQTIAGLIRGINVERDQRGAKRQCSTNDPQVQIGAVEPEFCNTAPRLNVPTSLLLNEPVYQFGAFGVEDDRLATDTLTLTMSLTNIASIDLPDDLSDINVVASNTVLQGRRANLQRVMESAGFTVDDMTQQTAEITFTLENIDSTSGLVTDKTLVIDLDINPPIPDVSDLPNQVMSRDPFTVTVTVDEPVGGLDVSKVQVVNGEALRATNVSPTEYELTLSANGGSDGEEPMFFQFLAGAVIDNAGNDSERSSEPYRVAVDLPEEEEDGETRSGGGGGSASLGPLGLILLLAGALRFRRNGL